MLRNHKDNMYRITVNGIPCLAYAFSDGPDYEDWDFELYDRKGCRAEWLDKYIDKTVIDLVHTLYVEEMRSYNAP